MVKIGRQEAVRVFTSAPIAKRYDVFTVETSDGVCILLKGLINKHRSSLNGFPSQVRDLSRSSLLLLPFIYLFISSLRSFSFLNRSPITSCLAFLPTGNNTPTPLLIITLNYKMQPSLLNFTTDHCNNDHRSL